MLRRGDTGTDVEELQVMLHALGLTDNDPEIAAFGPSTEDAVHAFQRRENLLIDGIVGPATLSALQGAADTSRTRAAAEATARKAARPAAVATGIGGVVTTATGVSGAARDVGGLWDGTAFGLVFVATLVTGLLGYLPYRYASQRAAEASA